MTSSTVFSNAADCAWLVLLRQDIKLTRFHLTSLGHRNLLVKDPVVAPGGPVVSLTTHGHRLKTVYLTLESIGAGTLLPSRLILWVDSRADYLNLPSSLRRLEARGLEVSLTENFGPHTKYYPYLLANQSFAEPLVTADDDVLYTRSWLASLYRAYRQNPALIHCHRAHRIRLIAGSLAPYAEWQRCRSTEPSHSSFATGVSGCIYPPEFLRRLRTAGAAFLDLCPRADDLWLHVNALRAGFKVSQIGPRQLNFPFLPGTQDAGLSRRNVGQGLNDAQIAKTYTARDVALMAAETQHGKEAIMRGTPSLPV